MIHYNTAPVTKGNEKKYLHHVCFLTLWYCMTDDCVCHGLRWFLWSGSSARFYSGLCLCLAAVQHESSGKQKHYGCHSVSYSGNTVLQLKYNDSKRFGASLCSARRHFNCVSEARWAERRAYLDPRLSFWKFSPAVTGKSFCLISLGTA